MFDPVLLQHVSKYIPIKNEEQIVIFFCGRGVGFMEYTYAD